jgi:hypothetical protein
LGRRIEKSGVAGVQQLQKGWQGESPSQALEGTNRHQLKFVFCNS